MTKLTATACIWDLDHTLYHAVTPYVPGFPKALASVLRAHGIDQTQVSEDDIIRIANTELPLRGSSYPYYVERFGLDKAALAAGVGAALTADEVSINAELRGLFAASPLRHVINTHADAQWCRQVLQHLGLADFFADDHIIYHAQHDFAVKSASPATHQAALRAAGVAAGQAVMVDDAVKNLRIPKEMGMQTIWLAYDATADVPTYVDAVVNCPTQVFALISAPAA